MYYSIKKLEKDDEIIEKVKFFLFKLIKEEYGLDYVPKYHYDIINLKEFYLEPENNEFFFAVNPENNEIIGTIGVRGYDKNFNKFQGLYNKNNTASFWRVFVNKEYRRNHIASRLVKQAEEFASTKNYREIYLHTQKSVIEGYKFWKSLNYNVTFVENEDTIHMEKKLIDNHI